MTSRRSTSQRSACLQPHAGVCVIYKAESCLFRAGWDSFVHSSKACWAPVRCQFLFQA